MDFNKLSVCYTVFDYDSGEIKEISVLDSDDLYAITSLFSGKEHCAGVVNSRLSNIKSIVDSPQDVTWYAASEDDFGIEDALNLAKSQGNSVIVIEMLPNSTEETADWLPK